MNISVPKIGFIYFVTTFLLVTQFTFAQNPTQAPPNGNAPAPVNVSSATQQKSGLLQVGAVDVLGGLDLGSVSLTGTCVGATEGSVVYVNGSIYLCADANAVTTGTSSEIWTANGSTVYYDAGGVAIGTDTLSPNTVLTVDGNLGSDAFCDALGNNCILQSDIGRSPWGQTSGNLYFNTGNVGIGTEFPANALTIEVTDGSDQTPFLIRNTDAGVHSVSMRLVNGNQASQISSRRTGTNSGSDLIFSTNNTSGVLTEGIRLTEQGRIGLGDSTPDGTLKVDVNGNIGANSYCDQNGNNCVLAANLSDSFWTAGPSSDIYRLAGNVGVGLTAPEENLHVDLNARIDGRHLYFGLNQDLYGEDSFGLFYDSGNTTSSAIGLRTQADEFLGGIFGRTGGFMGTIDANGFWSMIHETNQFTQFRVANQAVLTLEGNGAVLIGTTTPTTGLSLDVEGRVGATEFCAADGTDCFAAADATGLWTANGANAYRDTGNVGIGVNNPLYKLDLRDNTGVGTDIARFRGESDALFITNQSAGDYTIRNSGQNNGIFFADGTGGIQLQYNGSTAFQVDNSGGAEVVTGNLRVVAGNATVNGGHVYLGAAGNQDLYGDNGSNLYFDSNNATSAQFNLRDSGNNQLGSIRGVTSGGVDLIGILDGDNNWAMQARTDQYTRWYVNNSEVMRMRPEGLSIGGTALSGTLALDVTGAVGATEYCDEDGANCIDPANLGGAWTLAGADIYRQTGDVTIGATTPSGTLKLDVEGQVGATEYCDQGGANCFTAADVSGAGGGGGGIVTGGGTTNTLAKFNSGGGIADSQLSEAGSVVNASGDLGVLGGHVYLGAAGAQDLYGDNGVSLYYDSNNTTQARIYLRDSQNDRFGGISGQQGDYIGFLDGDNQWAIQHHKDTQTSWRINNVEQMRLTTTGLGIGLAGANPTSKLDVNIGSSRLKSFTNGLSIDTNTTGGWARSYRLINPSNDTQSVAFGAVTGSAYISASYDNTTDGTGYLNRDLTVDSNGNVAIGPNGVVSAGLMLDVAGAVGATSYCDENGANCISAGGLSGPWTIAGSNLNRATGNVSIGSTVATDSRLLVQGDGTLPEFKVEYGGSNNHATIEGPTNRSLRFDLDDNGAGDEFIFRAKNASAGTTNLMVIQADGAIGIAKTNIAAQLHINDNGISRPILMLEGGSGTEGDIVVPDGDAIQIGHWNTTTDTYTGRLRINNDGRVALGNGVPSGSLAFDANGQVGATEYCDSNGANCTAASAIGGDDLGNHLATTGIGRSAHNVGHLVGSYNNVGNNQSQTNPIYTIGSNYNPALTTLTNMYGIGFTNGSATFVTGTGSGWGMYVASDGDARTFLSASAAGNSYIGAGGGGNVGIGTASPTQKLHVAGNVLATGYIQSSDRNLKTNIQTVAKPTDVLGLRGVSFDWKEDGRSDYGFIAQEVEKLYPELVFTDEETGLKSVNYANISALLLEVVKEQEDRLDNLEARLLEIEKN